MENMNCAGRAPNAGDSIVLASAPASGTQPCLAFLPAPPGLGTNRQSLNPATFLAWDTDLGSFWPGMASSPQLQMLLLSSSALRVLSADFLPTGFPHKLYFLGRGGGRGGEGRGRGEGRGGRGREGRGREEGGAERKGDVVRAH